MPVLTRIPSAFTTSFSEGLRVVTAEGAWIFISRVVGMPMQSSDPKPESFEAEVRVCFDRIAASLAKFGTGLQSVVNIKAYLTDLEPYAQFSRVRGEVFAKDPPTSTAVQVTGLLLNAHIEIDAIAFVPGAAAPGSS
jgi:enamine deaminase RidA (YjgF/YER057c/UK114 family)